MAAAALLAAVAARALAASDISADGHVHSGFAPATEPILAPLAYLAPPGRNRAARSLALLDRTLVLQRKLAFHPVLGPRLRRLVDKLPPYQSALVRAASLYSRTDLGWSERPPDVHYIGVAGQPGAHDYLFSLAPAPQPPVRPGDLAAVFALRPAGPLDDAGPGVIGEFDQELAVDGFAAGAMVDLLAGLLRQVYGDLRPPWDSAPGAFNQHDRAALARLARDLPASAERLRRFLKFANLLDEMKDGSGPLVLFNLDATVREESLAPFPRLRVYYRATAPRLEARMALDDGRGHQWLRLGFERGRLRIMFLLRNGMLAPLSLAAAGEPVALERLEHGHYRCAASLRVRQMGMEFGFDNLTIETDYHRSPSSLRLASYLSATPDLIAPPLMHGLLRMLGGEFMGTLTGGNHGRGLAAAFSSGRQPGGKLLLRFNLEGEFRYSPALDFIVRVGDALAGPPDAAIGEEAYRLGEELFDTFVADLRAARPTLLALDRASND